MAIFNSYVKLPEGTSIQQKFRCLCQVQSMILAVAGEVTGSVVAAQEMRGVGYGAEMPGRSRLRRASGYGKFKVIWMVGWLVGFKEVYL